MKNEKQVLRDKTNSIIDSLTPENKRYFKTIQEYMILKSFFKDEKTILEQLYVMASDLKVAEKDGLSAMDFFGTDSKEMADQLLKNAPKVAIKDIASIYFSAVFILFGIEILVLFSETGHFQLELLMFVASCINASLICWIVFTVLPKFLFKEKQSKVIMGLIVVGSIILFNVIFRLPDIVGDKGIYLTFPEVVDWVFVIVTSIVVLLLSLKKRAIRAATFPILAFLLLGVIKKLIAMRILSGELWSTWIPLCALVLGMLVFYVVSYRSIKEIGK
ncbi:hypothetical protein [Streptococcus halotolerans]|uniref:hypothetical protein n=1 Tax=Streptococcus halotolerans TaxID=1814128 RepID=UPI00078781B9|nr:hypothetical protein [Streptococcus halotolerans]